jgi:NADP-dependent 3-hydroxy acid dehydrogenase YdfG
MHTVHQLASTPGILVFMGKVTSLESDHNNSTLFIGSRKLAAAEEALSKFVSDIHPSSTIVPVQLDITDDASMKNAHTFIAKYLQEHNYPGLDVLVNK